MFLILSSSAFAFFETSSNNIIVTNNLYNGSFNLSSITLDDIQVGNINITNTTTQSQDNFVTLTNGENWFYSEEGSTTGGLRIEFPHNSINFSVIVEVGGYDTTKGNLWEGEVYGTFNAINSWTTGLCDAKISGETPFTSVIFGYRNNKPVIDFGFSNTALSNPKFWIKKVTIVGDVANTLDWSSIITTKNTRTTRT